MRWRLVVSVALALGAIGLLTGNPGVTLSTTFSPMFGRYTERYFFYPDQVVYTTPQALGLAAQDLRFPGPDGSTLHAWWMPARGPALGTVLHVHGNAANISNHLPLVAWLPAA